MKNEANRHIAKTNTHINESQKREREKVFYEKKNNQLSLQNNVCY